MHIQKALNIHDKPTRKVGFVLKPHGFNGNFRIALDDEDFIPGDFLLLEINQKFVPFPIQSFNEDSLIIKLKGIDKVEQVETLVGMTILQLLDHADEEAVHELFGYTLTDQVSGTTYDITGISYLPNNTLIEFRNGFKDMLIPWHEDMIIDINHEAKTVLANFPDGILDL
jgi:16S rRNA processing protein RimM